MAGWVWARPSTATHAPAPSLWGRGRQRLRAAAGRASLGTIRTGMGVEPASCHFPALRAVSDPLAAGAVPRRGAGGGRQPLPDAAVRLAIRPPGGDGRCPGAGPVPDHPRRHIHHRGRHDRRGGCGRVVVAFGFMATKIVLSLGANADGRWSGGKWGRTW